MSRDYLASVRHFIRDLRNRCHAGFLYLLSCAILCPCSFSNLTGRVNKPQFIGHVCFLFILFVLFISVYLINFVLKENNYLTIFLCVIYLIFLHQRRRKKTPEVQEFYGGRTSGSGRKRKSSVSSRQVSGIVLASPIRTDTIEMREARQKLLWCSFQEK